MFFRPATPPIRRLPPRLRDGLRWIIDYPAGGLRAAANGLNLDLSLAGNAVIQSGEVGQELATGTTGYGLLADADHGVGIADYSITVWVRYTANGAARYLVGVVQVGGNQYWEVRLDANNSGAYLQNNVLWQSRNNGNTACRLYAASPVVINDGKWHVVTVTFDRANVADCVLAVDGLLVAAESFNNNPSGFVAWNTPIAIGALNNRGSLGSVANLTVGPIIYHNRRLSPPEVDDLHRALLTGDRQDSGRIILLSALPTGAGGMTHSGAAAVSAVSALSAVATRTAWGAATLTGVSTLTAAATRQIRGVAAVSATASVSAGARLVRSAAATVAATSALTADATVTSAQSASATVSATSALSATARVVRRAVAAITSTSGVAALARRVQLAQAAVSATSTLTATARLVFAGAATVGTTSALSATAARLRRAAAPLTATSALSATGRRIQPATAALTATSTLTAAGRTIRYGRAAVNVSTNAAAIGRLQATAAAVVNALAALTATATRISTSTLGAVNTPQIELLIPRRTIELVP